MYYNYLIWHGVFGVSHFYIKTNNIKNSTGFFSGVMLLLCTLNELNINKRRKRRDFSSDDKFLSWRAANKKADMDR